MGQWPPDHPKDQECTVQHGTVRWYDLERGFGFLAPDDGSADIFVHVSQVQGEGAARALREGQTVEFETGEGPRGPQALHVAVTGDASPDAILGVLATVSWYEPAKGYGFAAPDGGGAEVFVHSSAIVTGGVLAAGQRVAFVVTAGEKGPQAQHVVPLSFDAGVRKAPLVVPGDGADGSVLWFDEEKAFGFVAADDGAGDVFLHVRALVDDRYLPVEGDRVSFTTVTVDQGRQAREVRFVAAGEPVEAAAAPAQARSAAKPAARAGDGTVARYDADRGFGFITPDAGGPDLFVHVSVVSGSEPLVAGERVRFRIRQSDRGPQADSVERA
ncbi:cold-shock protein [Nocardia sp. NRRL S-836]|nr:cold-shock protein [Nocardia sp. NRRL S-836]